MIQYRDPPHYLKSLKTTTTPQRLLWLDCAHTTRKEQGVYIDRWQGGAIGSTHWTSKRNVRKDTLDAYDNPTGLWQRVDELVVAQRRSVLWSYDLAQQLRVSQGLLALPELGWTLDKIVLERTAAWARFTRDGRSLLMCDLKSWAPVELAKLAADTNNTNLYTREFLAGAGYHLHRCKWRATVVRDAVLQILGWIEGENLGPFRPTGSGQSYAAYRRRFLHDKILVHDDTDRLNAERVAMWTGRCEAWQHGKLTSGPYVEYDMQAAYCTIARDCDVPIVAIPYTGLVTVPAIERAMTKYAVLADVTVTTDVPCLPARMGGRTVWPVGTFRTWLWDPELQLALEHASRFKCHRAYTYHRGPALRDFAQYVLDGMHGQTQVYGLVPERVLKHWSRCLVGRLGLRYRAWEKFGTTPESDLQLVTYIDTDEGTATDLLCAGHDRFILADMSEAADSLPQIPSWVMSECRRRLWDAMAQYHLARVVYVDTDSIIMQASLQGHPVIPFHGLEAAGWTRKGEYSRMTIHGPRNYTADDARKVAGLPLTARQVAPLEFTGQVMRSIKESMRAGQLDCVAQIPRRFVLDAPDLRRQHLPNHETAPFEVTLPTSEGR